MNHIESLPNPWRFRAGYQPLADPQPLSDAQADDRLHQLDRAVNSRSFQMSFEERCRWLVSNAIRRGAASYAKPQESRQALASKGAGPDQAGDGEGLEGGLHALPPPIKKSIPLDPNRMRCRLKGKPMKSRPNQGNTQNLKYIFTPRKI